MVWFQVAVSSELVGILDEGLDEDQLAVRRIVHRVGAGSGRDDEGLQVVVAHAASVGGLHLGTAALDDHPDVAAVLGGDVQAASRMQVVAVHVVEVVGVRRQVLLHVVVRRLHDARTADERVGHHAAVALEADVVQAVLDVDRTGTAVDVEAYPVVHLEGEDVGRAADLEHQVARTRGVDRAVRDEEQVVLVRREALHVTLDVDRLARALALFEGGGEGGLLHALLESEVDVRLGRRTQDVIGLVLRIGLAEARTDVLRTRMALDREVAALDRIEEVEADREVLLEVLGAVAEHVAVGVGHEHAERNLEQDAVMSEHDAVLERHQLVGPRHVGRLAIEPADVVAQVGAAPDARREPRTDAEAAAAHAPQPLAQRLAAHEGPDVDALLVDDPVDARNERALPAIENRPVDEIAALVGFAAVQAARRAEVERRPGRHAELQFVLGQVDIDERRLPSGQRGTAAVEKGDVGGSVGFELLERRPVEEVDQQQIGHAAEDRILVAHERCDQGVDLRLRLQRPRHGKARHLPPERFERRGQRPDELVPQHAFVAVDNNALVRSDPLRQRLDAIEDLLPDFKRRIEVVHAGRCRLRLDRRQETVRFSKHDVIRYCYICSYIFIFVQRKQYVL